MCTFLSATYIEGFGWSHCWHTHHHPILRFLSHLPHYALVFMISVITPEHSETLQKVNKEWYQITAVTFKVPPLRAIPAFTLNI